MNQTWALWIAAGYYLMFAGTAVGLLVWKVKRKGGRLPVEFKLLRGPGETLWRRSAAFEEDFVLKLGLPALFPLAAVAPSFLFLNFWRPNTWLQFGTWASVTLVVFALALWLALRWAFDQLIRNRNDRTGYLGEREVGERLIPIIAAGYKVYHDVPADGARSSFNLDHVAIGPTGVAVIETKTRRKGPRREDNSEYRVYYDGEGLKWPWGNDRETIFQALALTDWTQKFIQQRTRLNPPLKTIVAIPGWWVEARPGPVQVVNSKNIATAVIGQGQVVLTSEQIELIAAQFDERCRDVVD